MVSTSAIYLVMFTLDRDDRSLIRIGLNDENQIRTAATNAFRRKAGYEMIFARADRVKTDANVHRYLRQSIKAHGAKGTILILTKKDVRNCLRHIA
jgi:hypothetical protein